MWIGVIIASELMDFQGACLSKKSHPYGKSILNGAQVNAMSITEEEINAFQQERRHMVETQIIRRGVVDPRVIAAMQAIPRHLFVPEAWRPEAYTDRPLPLACDQTISQPYMVAVMTEMLHLRPESKVLEIGTGSGYQAAILAHIAQRVISIERHAVLAKQAAAVLAALGCSNVRVIIDDGSPGYPEEEPYDAIIVTAGAPRIPPALPPQLAEGGRLVAPVGNTVVQALFTLVRHRDRFSWEQGVSCRFVPLVGAQGWNREESV